MPIHILNEKPSVLNHFLAELRDVHIQTDRLRFRTNLERIGQVMAYEVSRYLQYQTQSVTTPLGKAQVDLMTEQPVLATILRAGLPLHHGLTSYFDKADHAYISAFRKHTSDHDFEIELKYFASPSLENRILIISDPMLASGHSIITAYHALLKHGKPKQIHILAVISSRKGLQYVQQNLPNDTHIWVAAVDEELNAQSYIVPGLGDAGDLAFGEKL